MRFPDRRNDHEAEIVIVIGKQGSDIPNGEGLRATSPATGSAST